MNRLKSRCSSPEAYENLAVLDLVIPKNGYIYIYVANESPTNVYFDNLNILHKKSNVSELNDYYPFGLLNQTQSQTNLSFDPMNNYQYQGKEQQIQLGLNTLDFGLRHYDATLGRWGGQYPKMQYFNPYVAMGNNPVSMIDPDGGWNYTPELPGDGMNNEETSLSGGAGGGTMYSSYMQNANLDGWFAGFYGSGGTDIGFANVFTDASGQTYTQAQRIELAMLAYIKLMTRSYNMSPRIDLSPTLNNPTIITTEIDNVNSFSAENNLKSYTGQLMVQNVIFVEFKNGEEFSVIENPRFVEKINISTIYSETVFDLKSKTLQIAASWRNEKNGFIYAKGESGWDSDRQYFMYQMRMQNDNVELFFGSFLKTPFYRNSNLNFKNWKN